MKSNKAIARWHPEKNSNRSYFSFQKLESKLMLALMIGELNWRWRWAGARIPVLRIFVQPKWWPQWEGPSAVLGPTQCWKNSKIRHIPYLLINRIMFSPTNREVEVFESSINLPVEMSWSVTMKVLVKEEQFFQEQGRRFRCCPRKESQILPIVK